MWHYFIKYILGGIIVSKQIRSLLAIFLLLVIFVCCYFIFNSGGYKTEITWSLEESAVFSVENDEFDGDSLEAGTYTFTEETVIDKRIPIVWDIYISDKLLKKTQGLNESEFEGSVGGLSKEKLKLDLSKGQYVYIIYNKTAGDGTGHLVIKKVD